MSKKYVTLLIANTPNAWDISGRKKGQGGVTELEIIEDPSQETLVRRTLSGPRGWLEWASYQIKHFKTKGE